MDAGALDGLVVEAGEVLVHHLRAEEVPQEPEARAAVLNVTGWTDNRGDARVGVCLMLAGRAADGRPVWACHLPGVHAGRGPMELFESVLVPPEALGRTARVWVRVACTGTLAPVPDGPAADPAGAPDHGGGK